MNEGNTLYQLTEPQETESMSTPQPVPFIQNLTLVQGKDVTKMTDQEIYGVISNKEAEIETLEKIKHKPAKLVKQIEQIKADIKTLVDLVDKQDAPKAE